MSTKKTAKEIFEAVNNLITAYNHPKPGKGWLSTEDLAALLKTNTKNARYYRNKLVKAKLGTIKYFIQAKGKSVSRHAYIMLGKEAKKAFGLP